MPEMNRLEEVEKQLSNWRRDKKGKGREVPSEVRKQIVELLSEYNVSTVLKKLNLNHKCLKTWKQEYQVSEPVFIELPPEPNLEQKFSVNNLLLRVSREIKGEKLTIEGNLTFKEWKRAIGLLS